MPSDAAARLHHAMRAAGFRRDRSVTRGARYVGMLSAAGRELQVAFWFADLDFLEFPALEVLDRAEMGDAIAHLDDLGGFCYVQRGTLVLDRRDVGAAVVTCIALARRALEDVLGRRDHSNEIAQEFPQHWHGKSVMVDLRGDGRQGAHLYKVPTKEGKRRLLLTDADGALKAFGADNRAPGPKGAAPHEAIVLSTDRELTFKPGEVQPANLGQWADWAERTQPGLGNALVQAAGSSYPEPAVIFIDGPNGCVGAMLELPPIVKVAAQRPKGFGRLVKEHRYKVALTRYAGERIDPDFIFVRNLNGNPNLAGKRIALFGCGTIGSHLAKFLAQSGAGHGGGSLLLFDGDNLKAGNIGRHFLGLMHVARNKATACAEELLRLFPESSIIAAGGNALEQIDSLWGMDLLIDATGEEPFSAALNERLMSRRAAGKPVPDSLYVWLFGNGAAAQALICVSAETPCYNCLRPDGVWRFSPMLPGVDAVTVPAACGEAPFTPYGVAAPAVAAGLAMKMCLDWAAGRPRPTLRTLRLEQDGTRQVKDHTPTKSPRCPACAAG